MPRNGHTATTQTAEKPLEIYDTLTQADQDLWDQIGVLGYVPERGQTGLWMAKKRTGGVAVGPANNLKDLLSRVKDDIAGDADFDNDVDASKNGHAPEKGILLTEDHKGNRYLPGAEEIVDEQLKNAAYDEYADKEAWKEAGKKKKNSKAALEVLAATKKHLFYEDPSKPGDLIYRVGKLRIRAGKEIKLTVKTELVEDEDDE